ncbi:hypothetical protein LTS18_014555, partial [Coniosporium uncinatum]
MDRTFAHQSPAAGSQAPQMLEAEMLSPDNTGSTIRPPALCHCRDEGASTSAIPPPTYQSHNESRSFFPENLPDRPQPRQNNQFLAFLGLIASCLGLTILISFIHRRCMSLRRLVDRRADQEERRAARAYRCMARKQRVRDWWYGRQRQQRTDDYDEKRALIIQQENTLENAMQDEIMQLRNAHDI